MESSFSEAPQEYPEPKNVRHEVLLRIPAGCRVHLMEEGEAVEIANGEFLLERISDENVSLAAIIKVGEDLQWPLTKDEPVVRMAILSAMESLFPSSLKLAAWAFWTRF
jgi:hypothetical protein